MKALSSGFNYGIAIAESNLSTLANYDDESMNGNNALNMKIFESFSRVSKKMF